MQNHLIFFDAGDGDSDSVALALDAGPVNRTPVHEREQLHVFVPSAANRMPLAACLFPTPVVDRRLHILYRICTTVSTANLQFVQCHEHSSRRRDCNTVLRTLVSYSYLVTQYHTYVSNVM